MNVTGTVCRTSGNYANVKTQRPKACESCSNYALCSGKDIDIKVLNTVGAKVGDSVEVEVSEDSRVMYLMAYIFLIPVVAIFLFYYLFTLSPLLLLFIAPCAAGYGFGLYVMNKKFKLRSEILRITEDSFQCDRDRGEK